MANPNLPKYHNITNALNKKPNKQFVGLDGYVERVNAKLEDRKLTSAWLDDELGVQTHIDTVKDELVKLDYYGQMPEVTIDPSIKEFFNANKDSLNDLNSKIQDQKSQYMAAYESWQDQVENMDDRRRTELGLSYDFHHQEQQARNQIRTSKEQMKNAKQTLREAKQEVSPLRAIIGRIAGTDNKSLHKVRDARRQLRNAKISFKEAKRRLIEIQERRDNRQDGMEKLKAKEYAALLKMATAQENMEIHRQGADKIAQNMKKVQDRLAEQYKVIDKYKAIQEFKNSSQYGPASRETLKNTDRALYDKLESFPERLPAKAFTITLTGPLQFMDNADKITEVSQKIDELKSKVPDAIGLPNSDKLSPKLVQEKIDSLALPTGENRLHEVAEQMSKITDKSSNEYKQLKMKYEYMLIENKVNFKKEQITTKQNKIDAIMAEYNNATTPKAQQEALAKLEQPKDEIKKLKEELKELQNDLDNHPYSRTLAGLTALKNSLEEKAQLESVRDLLSTVDPIHQSLEHSPVMMEGNYTIKAFFETRVNAIRQRLESRLSLPQPENQNEQEQNSGERDEDEGR